MLVKPKCIWQWKVYLKNCKQTPDENENIYAISQAILALPIMGQKCLDSELQSFNISNLDPGHPV